VRGSRDLIAGQGSVDQQLAREVADAKRIVAMEGSRAEPFESRRSDESLATLQSLLFSLASS